MGRLALGKCALSLNIDFYYNGNEAVKSKKNSFL